MWNTLVMVARVRRVLELLRAVRPADIALLEETPLDLAALATVYDRLPAWNFSQEFLSRIPEHLVGTRADDLGWSDWGTPEAMGDRWQPWAWFHRGGDPSRPRDTVIAPGAGS
jgi:hypothetical protein